MQDRRTRPRRTLRALAHVFERGTSRRLRARDTLQPYSPIPRLRESGFFCVCALSLVSAWVSPDGVGLGVGLGVSRWCLPMVSAWVSPDGVGLGIGTKRQEEVRKSRRKRQGIGTKRQEEVRKSRRNRPNRRAEIDRNRPKSTEIDRIGRPPSTLFCRASGIRSSFSQFFCPPLRFFTKVL